MKFNYECRAPKKIEEREKWIAAIGDNLTSRYNRSSFNVCINHFREIDLITARDKSKVLASHSVPSIFNMESTKSTAYTVQPELPESPEIFCNKCENFQFKIKELEKQIEQLKFQHNVELERQKVNSAKQKERYQTSKKEVSKRNAELNSLKDVIEKLRQDRFISNDDARFLNVRFHSVLCSICIIVSSLFFIHSPL